MNPRLVEPVTHPLSAIATFLNATTQNVNVDDAQSINASAINASAINASGLTSRAHDVEPGDIFLAFPGERTHGARFADEAQRRGAISIITDSAGAALITAPIPILVVENPRHIAGHLAGWFYDQPLRSLFSAAITGTNGKTTVTTLLYQLWRDAQIESGLIGTLGTFVGRDFLPSARTTPEADELHAIFAMMKERHVKNLAMEVSSHALVQHRVDGMKFSVAGFTHLTQDHLDFHGSMANYFDAKARLFTLEHAEKAFIMIDDEYGRALTKRSEIPYVTLSRSDTSAQWHVANATMTSTGWDLAIRGDGGILIEGSLPLLGEHNIDNALLAIAIAVESGLDPLFVGRQLSHLTGAVGRLEKISLGQNFLALIDYAHTPDAVTRTLASVRKFTQGRIIAVLGCGGDRDKSKRPLMGEALRAGSDIALFTSDNPRSENPDDILRQMVGDIRLAQPSAIIQDRREAISTAVKLADKGDCVIVLGKGHETGQEIASVIHPFSDREVVEAEIVDRMAHQP